MLTSEQLADVRDEADRLLAEAADSKSRGAIATIMSNRFSEDEEQTRALFHLLRGPPFYYKVSKWKGEGVRISWR